MPGAVSSVLHQLDSKSDTLDITVQGCRIPLTNLGKRLRPEQGDPPPVTKRDLLVYLARVSAALLPKLRDRPLTMSRYPDGIHGEHFYQKHWSGSVPGFVQTVPLASEHAGGTWDYLMCNNLATLLWLGQAANIELHPWFSRVAPGSEGELTPPPGPMRQAVTPQWTRRGYHAGCCRNRLCRPYPSREAGACR